MIKKCLLFAVVALAYTAPAMAQASPFTSRPVSQEGYAKAIEDDDQTILNVPCASIVKAANEVYNDLKLKDCAGLASYIRKLVVKPLPTGKKATFARILSDANHEDVVDLPGHERYPRVGEMALFDNNRVVFFASLSCGNLITSPLPVFTAMVIEDEAKKAAKGMKLERDKAVRGSGEPNWLSRNKGWVIPAAIGAGVGAAFASRSTNVNKNYNNNR